MKLSVRDDFLGSQQNVSGFIFINLGNVLRRGMVRSSNICMVNSIILPENKLPHVHSLPK